MFLRWMIVSGILYPSQFCEKLPHSVLQKVEEKIDDFIDDDGFVDWVMLENQLNTFAFKNEIAVSIKVVLGLYWARFRCTQSREIIKQIKPMFILGSMHFFSERDVLRNRTGRNIQINRWRSKLD